MTQTQQQAISQACKVVAENAARRFLAGSEPQAALEGALREFSAQWPVLGAKVRQVLS